MAMDPKFRAEYLRKTEAIIDEHGWAVQAVLGSAAEGGGFSYTIGFTRTLGHPEIFMAGFNPETCRQLLNDVGGLIREGDEFKVPRLSERVVKNFNVAFRPLDPRSVRRNSGVGQEILGEFEAVQMFLPDPSGRFPWEPGCDRAYVNLQTSLFKATGDIPTAEGYRAGMH